MKPIVFDLAADFRFAGVIPYGMSDEWYEAFVDAVLPAFVRAGVANGVEVERGKAGSPASAGARWCWESDEDYWRAWQTVHDEAEFDLSASLIAAQDATQ
jgi:hypothetical protein